MIQQTNQREIRELTEFPKYKIGNDGTVWSSSYKNTGKTVQMKQFFDKDGYKRIFLVDNKKRFIRLVHRLVAITFLINEEHKPQVNHKNGVRDDNRVENLEWATSKENCLHAYRVNGRKHSDKHIANMSKLSSGESNPNSKINEATVLSIRRCRAKGDSLASIAERVGLSKSQVSHIANNKFWKNI